MKTCPPRDPDESSKRPGRRLSSSAPSLPFLIALPLFRGAQSPVCVVYVLYPDVGSDETVWLAAFFLTTSLAVCTAIYFPRLIFYGQ